MATPASTKAGRAKIAAQFVKVAEKFGATIDLREESAGFRSGASLHYRFTLNGVGAQVSISDLHERHGGQGGLISWFNEQPAWEWQERRERLGYGVRYFAAGFTIAVGSSSSARPHHKATSCGDWDLLAARLQAGLRHAANGSAFLPDAVPS